MTERRHRLVSFSLLLAFSTATAPAFADDAKLACADAYHAAQFQRKNGTLRKARESLLVCASDKCPSILQPDCVRWLGEVEAAIPSVVFAAKGPDGKDVVEVRVSIDGEVVTDTLDGKAVVLDPGKHTIRFERPGEKPISQGILVREGEKARVVSASWAKPDTTSETKTVVVTEAARPVSSNPKTAAWIFTGVGVVGLATFGTLALLASNRRQELRDQCYGHCNESDIDDVKRRFLFADVALGVGIVSLGVATALFFGGSDGSSAGTKESARLGIAPTTTGGVAVLSGAF
jgi:hypothetical protein